jgi:hypothetical protein
VPVVEVDPVFEGEAGGPGSLVKYNPLSNVTSAEVSSWLSHIPSTATVSCCVLLGFFKGCAFELSMMWIVSLGLSPGLELQLYGGTLGALLMCITEPLSAGTPVTGYKQ